VFELTVLVSERPEIARPLESTQENSIRENICEYIFPVCSEVCEFYRVFYAYWTVHHLDI